MGKRGPKKQPRNCGWCHVDFMPTSRRVKYCSASCKKLSNKHRGTAMWTPQTHAIVQARKDNLYRTLKDIGNEYHITRERVRQILNNAGVPTVGLQVPLTAICGWCQDEFSITSRQTRKKYCTPQHTNAAQAQSKRKQTCLRGHNLSKDGVYMVLDRGKWQRHCKPCTQVRYQERTSRLTT